VITSDELGGTSGVVQIGAIGEVCFGALSAFDKAKYGYAYLAASHSHFKCQAISVGITFFASESPSLCQDCAGTGNSSGITTWAPKSEGAV